MNRYSNCKFANVRPGCCRQFVLLVPASDCHAIRWLCTYLFVNSQVVAHFIVIAIDRVENTLTTSSQIFFWPPVSPRRYRFQLIIVFLDNRSNIDIEIKAGHQQWLRFNDRFAIHYSAADNHQGRSQCSFNVQFDIHLFKNKLVIIQ